MAKFRKGRNLKPAKNYNNLLHVPLNDVVATKRSFEKVPSPVSQVEYTVSYNTISKLLHCSSVVTGRKRKQGQQYTPLPWTNHFDGCNDIEIQNGVIS